MANQIGGTIVWNLDIEDNGFQNKLNSARVQAQKLANETDNTFTNLGNTLSSTFARISSTVGAGLIDIGRLAVSQVGLVGGGGLIAFGVAAAFSASKIDELTFALHAIAKANGVTQKAVDDTVTSIRNQNISNVDAIRATQNFVVANIKLTDAVKLATAAKDLAIGTDYGSSDALATLTEAIVTNQTQTLQNFGILTTQTQAYGDYAKSIHKSAGDLTQQEKQQALLNIVLAAGAKRVGAYNAAQLSASKQFRSLTTRIIPDFIAQIGRAFEPALAVAVTAITVKIQDMGKWLDSNKTTVAKWGKTIAGAVKTGIDLFGKFINFLVKNKELVVGALVAIAGGIIALGVASIFAHGPAILVFTAITLAVAGLLKLFGGFGNVVKAFSTNIDFIKGKIAPLVAVFKTVRDRISQLLAGIGISGEAGGLQNIFAGLEAGAKHYTDRTLQILEVYWQKAKNFLAFGTTDGQAGLVDALKGIYNRVKPIIDALDPVFKKVGDNLALTGQIIQTQIKPAFEALVQASGPLLKALEPFIKDAISKTIIGLAIAIGAVVSVILAFVTGLVSGLANALPYVAQSFEGLIQFIRGVVQIITALLTGDLGLAWEGVKQAVVGLVEFFVNGFLSLLKFVSGFVEGVIGFFVALYNALIGHSIIPDMVNGIVAWFMTLPSSIYGAIISIVTLVPKVFTDAWGTVTSIVSNWVSDVYNWGVNIARSFADGFSQLGQWLKDKINDALNAAKKFLQGKSPPVAGPFKDIDKWGENVGMAWVQGVENAINSISFDNPMGSTGMRTAPQPAVAQARTSGNSPLVNIENMAVRQESDITDVARELGFRIENSTGFTQNG